MSQNRKGIILAGGSGTSLYPITKVISKQLLPIYDKPMIYYPLCTLLLAGIKDILLISTEEDLPLFQRLLGDGSAWGISLQYKIQPRPEGLAQAFILAEDFIGDDPSCLVLGDNIFYGHGLGNQLKEVSKSDTPSTVFGYYVNDPERYGVVEFNEKGSVISLEEKPTHPKSNYAIVGLYFYDNNVVNLAKDLKPSARGELEITDLNKIYLENDQLSVEILGRGTAWLDTGTHQSMVEATQFVESVENRQGLKISCPEEICWRNGYIGDSEIEKLAQPMIKTGYGKYLVNMLKRNMKIEG